MPEVDDGSIGGFNRPELRGLRKQARRGTLTNRERRRLNYLTNEAKGRRRRGLLSGLGGAAAALGTAALIKSGGAKGLMDSIKSRMSGLKQGLETRREEREIAKDMKPSKEDRNIEMIEPLKATPIDTGLEERGIVGVDENEAMMRQLQEERDEERDIEESDRLTDEEQLQDMTKEADKISSTEEAKRAGTYKRITPPSANRGNAPEEKFASGTSTEDMLDALQNMETPEEQQRIIEMMGAVKGGGGGPTVEEVQRDLLEKGRGSSGGPLDPDDFEEGQEVSVRRGGGPPLRVQSPMAPTPPGEGEKGTGPGSELLRNHNEQRIAMGLKPVMEITESSLMELEAGPLRRLKPLSPKPISRQAVGGMVRSMLNRYN